VCLARLHDVREVRAKFPKRERVTGWRLFKTNADGVLRSFHNNYIFTEVEWNVAPAPMGWVSDPEERATRRGFHVFPTLEGAQKVLRHEKQTWGERGYALRRVEFYPSDIAAAGETDWFYCDDMWLEQSKPIFSTPTYVVRRMYVCPE